jgi:hypothetical protein
MSGEAWLYLLAVLINAVNLFLQVFFTIMYSDLEWYVHFRQLLLELLYPFQHFRVAHNTYIVKGDDVNFFLCPVITSIQ